MDKLVINGLPITTTIGVLDWEQQCLQTLHLDITLHTDASQIALMDSIDDALNYDDVIQHVLQFAQTHHFQLIETFAENLAQMLLKQFATPCVQITLHKPGAVLKARNVSLTIERSRS